MGRIIVSDRDCADCLCRVCARNECNDSQNSNLENNEKTCSCGCDVFNEIVETEDDCERFLPDEDL